MKYRIFDFHNKIGIIFVPTATQPKIPSSIDAKKNNNNNVTSGNHTYQKQSDSEHA